MTENYNDLSTASLDIMQGNYYPKKDIKTPIHYDLKIQPVEFIVANDIPFREANIIKYVCRHREKGRVNDLLKAAHYLDMLIKQYLPQQNDLSK